MHDLILFNSNNFFLKIPFNEKETLDYLSQQEIDENVFGFGRDPKIAPVNDYAISFKGTIVMHQLEKILKRSLLDKILKPIFYLVFIALVSVGIYNLPDSEFGAILILCPLWLLLVIVLLIDIFSKDKNFNILLSQEGMTIKDIFYPWNEVYQVYFIIRSHGANASTKTYFMALALHSGTSDKYDISDIVGVGASLEKIAAYIVHFKSRS